MAGIPQPTLSVVPSPARSNPATGVIGNPQMPTLRAIERTEYVNPTVTNRQHRALEQRTLTLLQAVNLLIGNSNALDQYYLRRDGSVQKGGGSGMTGNLPMNSNRVTGLAAAVDGGDAVRKTEHDLKAPLASPALTGAPTSPNPVSGSDNTQIATTAWVRSRIASAAIEFRIPTHRQVFNVAMGAQTWTNPSASPIVVIFLLKGGGGGGGGRANSAGVRGGNGGRGSLRFYSVTVPGSGTLSIVVGGGGQPGSHDGSDGQSGGGGGSGSTVTNGATTYTCGGGGGGSGGGNVGAAGGNGGVAGGSDGSAVGGAAGTNAITTFGGLGGAVSGGGGGTIGNNGSPPVSGTTTDQLSYVNFLFEEADLAPNPGAGGVNATAATAGGGGLCVVMW